MSSSTQQDNSNTIHNNKNHEALDDEYYMRQALKVAKDALSVGEVPVGCVIVLPAHAVVAADCNGDNHQPPDAVIVSHGANQVNATRDATRHAEIVAIDRVLTGGASSDQLRLPPQVMAQSARTAAKDPPHDSSSSPLLQSSGTAVQEFFQDKWVNVPEDPQHWKNSFGWQSGRLLDVKTLSQCHLYVTCEPCIMCSAALAQIGFHRVIFGCRNDRFGGCGSILHLHELEIKEEDHHHTPYPITSGVLEQEAISLLRSFYDRENFHAPEDKRKRKGNEAAEDTTDSNKE